MELTLAADADCWGDWRRAVDPASGAAYYHNVMTSEVSWQRPAGWRSVSEPLLLPAEPAESAAEYRAAAPEDAPTAGAAEVKAAERERRERPVTLALLTTTLVFSYMDRQVLNSLFEDIKADLHLTDTQLGLLGGIAVSLFGALFGVHIARFADRTRRTTVLVACLAAWSVATAAGGAARNFGMLLVARTCVGVGEAGAIPISLAMLADAYPQAQRSSAMSVYYTGIPGGIILGLLLGGWLGSPAVGLGWRAALCTVGVPGGFFAAFVATRLREPPRGHADVHADEGVPGLAVPDTEVVPTLLQQLGALARCRTFVLLVLGGAFNLFTAIGMFAFMPSLLQRRFQVDSGVASSSLIGVMVFGGVATLAGGLADVLFKKHQRLGIYAVYPAAVIAASIPFSIYLCYAPSFVAAIFLFLPNTAAANVASGPIRCLASSIIPPSARSVSNSVMEVAIGLAGGLGPLAVGWVSDHLQAKGTDPAQALSLAMLSVQPFTVPAALCLWLASRSAAYDVKHGLYGNRSRKYAALGEEPPGEAH